MFSSLLVSRCLLLTRCQLQTSPSPCPLSERSPQSLVTAQKSTGFTRPSRCSGTPCCGRGQFTAGLPYVSSSPDVCRNVTEMFREGLWREISVIIPPDELTLTHVNKLLVSSDKGVELLFLAFLS